MTDHEGRTIDEIIADAKSSVRYVRENAQSLGINPNQIVTSGHSAGAYLSMATGMIDRFDEPSETNAVSSKPNAMVIWSGSDSRSENNTGEIMPENITMDELQPRSYMSNDLPPSVFIHGSADTLIPYEPTYALSKEIANAGNVTSFYLVDGVDHFFTEAEDRAKVFERIKSFMASLGYS